MVAAAGFLVAESFHPLFGGSIDVPSYVAFQATPLQTFWPIVVGGLLLIEAGSSLVVFADPTEGKLWTLKDGYENGDLGFDPLGLGKDSASLDRFREAEIIHGRWAMLGAAGCLAVELAGQGNWYDAPLWVSARGFFFFGKRGIPPLEVSAPKVHHAKIAEGESRGRGSRRRDVCV